MKLKRFIRETGQRAEVIKSLTDKKEIQEGYFNSPRGGIDRALFRYYHFKPTGRKNMDEFHREKPLAMEIMNQMSKAVHHDNKGVAGTIKRNIEETIQVAGSIELLLDKLPISKEQAEMLAGLFQKVNHQLEWTHTIANNMARPSY